MNTTLKATIAFALMIVSLIYVVGNVSAAQTHLTAPRVGIPGGNIDPASTNKLSMIANPTAIRPLTTATPTRPNAVVNPMMLGMFVTGNGFVITPDSSEGYATNLVLIRIPTAKRPFSEIGGKIMLKQTNYRIAGTETNGQVDFEVFTTNKNTPTGQFSGTLKRYGDFSLLTGKLTMSDKVFDMTIFSQNIGAQTRAISPNARTVAIENVKPQQTIAIGASPENGPTPNADGANVKTTASIPAQIYITPTQIIARSRFLGVAIPFTTDKVKLQVVDKDGNTNEETVSENSNTNIDGYNVAIGSLANPDNIEISIRSTAQ